MTKTNKSFTKRLKATKNGKILARNPGLNHFNAKQSRTTQLQNKKLREFKMSNKNKQKFLS